MVRLHALCVQQFEQAPFGLLVHATHQRKAFAGRRCILGLIAVEGEDALAGYNLKQVARLLTILFIGLICEAIGVVLLSTS